MLALSTNIEADEDRLVTRLYGQKGRPKYTAPSRIEIIGKQSLSGSLSRDSDFQGVLPNEIYYETGHHDFTKVLRYEGYDATDMMSDASISSNRIYSRGKFPSKSGQGFVVPRRLPDFYFQQLNQKVTGFSKLPNNWDGYGASAPNSVSISHALLILTILERLRLRPSCVTPSVENGIAISFVKLSKYSDMECFNSGEVLAVMSDGNGSPDVWELQAGNQEIELAAQKIREFLQ